MYEQSFNPFAQNLQIIKGYFKRKTTLILGILVIIAALLGAATTFIIGGSTSSLISQIMAAAGQDVSSNGYALMMQSMSSGTMISNIISTVITLVINGLIAFAFILIYVKSNNDDPAASPYAGFTIIYVFSVISLVLCCIASAILLFSILVLVIAAGFTGYVNSDIPADAIGAIAGVASVFVLLLIIMMLFISITQVRFYGNIRKSMTGVELSRKGAAPFGVLNVIFAICGGLGVLGSILYTVVLNTVLPSVMASAGININLSSLFPIMIISIVAGVLGVVEYIFYAKWALGYKKYIDGIKNGFTPAYVPEQPGAVLPPVPPVAPAPAPAQNPYTAPAAAPAEPKPEIDYVLPQTICPACGSPVENDNSFCSNCGHKLK